MTEPGISAKVLAVTVIATSLTFIDATALNQALHAIGNQFSASSSQTLWIVGAYSLTLVIALAPAGVLADRFGCREILTLGIMLFTAASLMCAVASNVSWLISARALQGIGGGLMITGSLALLTSCSHPSQRGRSIGKWTAWCAVATIVGPLLGGTLAEAGRWTLIFWINVPLALVAVVLLRGIAPIRRASNTRLVPPKPVWTIPIVRQAIALTVLIDTAFYGLLLVIPLTLINGAGYRADQSAAAQLALVLALVLVCPTAGRWFDQRGPRSPVRVGALLSLLGSLWLGLGGVGENASDYLAHLLVPMILIGAGMGLAIVGLSSTVMNAVGEDILGAAAAVNALAARTAAAISIGLFGAVLLCHGVDLHAPASSTIDWQQPFQQSMFLVAFACGSTIFVASSLPNSRAFVTTDDVLEIDSREQVR